MSGLAETADASVLMMPCYDLDLVSAAPAEEWALVRTALRKYIKGSKGREPIKYFAAQTLAFLNSPVGSS